MGGGHRGSTCWSWNNSSLSSISIRRPPIAHQLRRQPPLRHPCQRGLEVAEGAPAAVGGTRVLGLVLEGGSRKTRRRLLQLLRSSPCRRAFLPLNRPSHTPGLRHPSARRRRPRPPATSPIETVVPAVRLSSRSRRAAATTAHSKQHPYHLSQTASPIGRHQRPTSSSPSTSHGPLASNSLRGIALPARL